MKTPVFFLCVSLILCSCGRYKKDLERVEKALYPMEAVQILDSINPELLRGRQAAMYAMLRTRTDYIVGREITSDSLSLIATNYWGSRRRGYYTSRSWMALGCAYSNMKKDPEAIYALLKSKQLFKDTISADYASVNSLLGTHYLNMSMLDEAEEAFILSHRLYHTLGDCHMESFSEFSLGKVYLWKKEYDRALDIMLRMLDDECLYEKYRNMCYFYLAHIVNGLRGTSAGYEELGYVNKYLETCTNTEELAEGYAMKGIALYYIHESDSAFAYLQRAHRLSNKLSTKIFTVNGLEWVAVQMKKYQAAWNAEVLNKQYQEELNAKSNEREITKIRLQYNDEIQEHKFRTRVSRIVLVSILLLIVVIAVTLIVSIQRDRKREAYYLNKYDDLIQKQIEEKAKSKDNRLIEACEAFRTGIAFNLVGDVTLQKRPFRQEERDVVAHDINLYFASDIASLRGEAGKLSQQDINLIFCTLLGYDQEIIAEIMCTSRSNLRSIKSRLKSRISAETFSLYFNE